MEREARLLIRMSARESDTVLLSTPRKAYKAGL